MTSRFNCQGSSEEDWFRRIEEDMVERADHFWHNYGYWRDLMPETRPCIRCGRHIFAQFDICSECSEEMFTEEGNEEGLSYVSFWEQELGEGRITRHGYFDFKHWCEMDVEDETGINDSFSLP